MKRRKFVQSAAIMAASIPMTMRLNQFGNLDTLGSSDKMPVLFIGHGNPMNALYDNAFTRHLTDLGTKMEKPKAILVVSAHWLTHGTYVSTSPTPKTIHDFGGFPEELFQLQYPAKGSPEFAEQTITQLSSIQVHADHEMGLDHGAWTVLRHMYPMADVPVYQLSIDYDKPAEFHFQLGKQLAALRTKGVLIIGSGNLVHNLGRVKWEDSLIPYDWAQEFDQNAKRIIDNRTFDELINYQQMGEAAKLSVPTPDHYYPLMYSLGLVESKDEITHTYEGMEMGSISMRCLKIA
ncbi:MAG: 4,5-DOPA dioxygenase extradiol [Saprospiraceae bacterium]